jgi:hypothetical protein
MATCACKTPFPDYPTVLEWSPMMWKILHAFSLKSGKPISSLFVEDEKMRWYLLLKGLPEVIVCKDCRSHLQEYIRLHPVESVRTMKTSELNEFLTNYFFEMHNSVNRRLGKPEFDKAMLESTYKDVDIRAELKLIKKPIETAILLSGVKILSWNKWYGYALMLLTIYGS